MLALVFSLIVLADISHSTSTLDRRQLDFGDDGGGDWQEDYYYVESIEELGFRNVRDARFLPNNDGLNLKKSDAKRKPRPHRALGGQRPYRGNSRSSDGVKDGGGRYDSLSAPGPPYDDQVVIQHFLEKEKEKEFEDEFITSTYSAENSVKSGKQSWKNPLKSTQQIREFGTDKSVKLELSEGGSDEPVPTQGLTHNTDPYRFNRPPNQENSAPPKPWQPIPDLKTGKNLKKEEIGETGVKQEEETNFMHHPNDIIHQYTDDGKENKKGKSDGAPQNEFREPKSQFKRDEKQQEQEIKHQVGIFVSTTPATTSTTTETTTTRITTTTFPASTKPTKPPTQYPMFSSPISIPLGNFLPQQKAKNKKSRSKLKIVDKELEEDVGEKFENKKRDLGSGGDHSSNHHAKPKTSPQLHPIQPGPGGPPTLIYGKPYQIQGQFQKMTISPHSVKHSHESNKVTTTAKPTIFTGLLTPITVGPYQNNGNSEIFHISSFPIHDKPPTEETSRNEPPITLSPAFFDSDVLVSTLHIQHEIPPNLLPIHDGSTDPSYKYNKHEFPISSHKDVPRPVLGKDITNGIFFEPPGGNNFHLNSQNIPDHSSSATVPPNLISNSHFPPTDLHQPILPPIIVGSAKGQVDKKHNHYDPPPPLTYYVPPNHKQQGYVTPVYIPDPKSPIPPSDRDLFSIAEKLRAKPTTKAPSKKETEKIKEVKPKEPSPVKPKEPSPVKPIEPSHPVVKQLPPLPRSYARNVHHFHYHYVTTPIPVRLETPVPLDISTNKNPHIPPPEEYIPPPILLEPIVTHPDANNKPDLLQNPVPIQTQVHGPEQFFLSTLPPKYKPDTPKNPFITLPPTPGPEQFFLSTLPPKYRPDPPLPAPPLSTPPPYYEPQLNVTPDFTHRYIPNLHVHEVSTLPPRYSPNPSPQYHITTPVPTHYPVLNVLAPLPLERPKHSLDHLQPQEVSSHQTSFGPEQYYLSTLPPRYIPNPKVINFPSPPSHNIHHNALENQLPLISEHFPDKAPLHHSIQDLDLHLLNPPNPPVVLPEAPPIIHHPEAPVSISSLPQDPLLLQFNDYSNSVHHQDTNYPPNPDPYYYDYQTPARFNPYNHYNPYWREDFNENGDYGEISDYYESYEPEKLNHFTPPTLDTIPTSSPVKRQNDPGANYQTTGFDQFNYSPKSPVAHAYTPDYNSNIFTDPLNFPNDPSTIGSAQFSPQESLSYLLPEFRTEVLESRSLGAAQVTTMPEDKVEKPIPPTILNLTVRHAGEPLRHSFETAMLHHSTTTPSPSHLLASTAMNPHASITYTTTPPALHFESDHKSEGIFSSSPKPIRKKFPATSTPAREVYSATTSATAQRRINYSSSQPQPQVEKSSEQFFVKKEKVKEVKSEYNPKKRQKLKKTDSSLQQVGDREERSNPSELSHQYNIRNNIHTLKRKGIKRYKQTKRKVKILPTEFKERNLVDKSKERNLVDESKERNLVDESKERNLVERKAESSISNEKNDQLKDKKHTNGHGPYLFKNIS